MGFWGPNMARAIEYAHKHGIPENISPSDFCDRMDKLCGTPHQGMNHPEHAARNWLLAVGIAPPNPEGWTHA